MDNLDIIEQYFKEATKDFESAWFDNVNSNWYNHVMDLPENLKTTYLIAMLHEQVFNGGFHQYYTNGYGQFSVETIDALHKVGLHQKADILQRAFDKVNNTNETNSVFREKLLEAKIKSLFESDELSEPLSELNNEYDSNTEDVIQLLADYLKK